MDCGVWIYDALSGFRSPKLHVPHRTKRVQELVPGLRGTGLKGGISYWDCATDDARLTIENIMDARAAGAIALNHVRATKLLKEGDRFVGAEVGDGIAVKAKLVVNATGPWCDELRASYGASKLLKPTKGVHIVVDRARLPLGRALLVKQGKRVVFCLPWGARSVIGTTDTFYEGPIDEAEADRSDVDYLLEVGNHYFPEAKLVTEDVLATWSGLRPLLAPSEAEGASEVSREHHIESQPGLVTIAGGKLTTYRRMSAEVVDTVAAQLDVHAKSTTHDRPLPGGVGIDNRDVLRAMEPGLGVEPDIARHLVETYGARAPLLAERIAKEPALGARIEADLPFVMAEVDEAVEREQAWTLCDLMERRVPLSLHGRKQGLDVAAPIAQRMGTLLGWSDADVQRELGRYDAAIAATRRFRA
jgi:glycerol-3-phosphate dehydrogenase